MLKLNIIYIILLLFVYEAEAYSWRNISWKEMIDSSDVIVLVEYTKKGTFGAKAKPLKVYKGNINTNEIWISCFELEFEPLDKMKPGDQYIVFANLLKYESESAEYWNGRIKDNPKLKEFVEAMKLRHTYLVRTPICCNVKVEGNQVQYDLMNSSFNKEQSLYPLKEFEDFLNATKLTENSDFHQQNIDKIKVNIEDTKVAQYLMMLYLTSFNKYDPIFNDLAKASNFETCLALAKLLGEIKGKESEKILVELIEHEEFWVRDEAFDQLNNRLYWQSK